MYILKLIILFISDVLGLNALFKKLNSKKIRILMYHCVTLKSPKASCWTILPVSKFRWQMYYIKKNYYNIPASKVFCENTYKTKNESLQLIISFDDGYENTLTNAWQILKELNLRAICFVIPGLSLDNKFIWADFLFEVFTNPLNKNINLNDYGIEFINFQFDINKAIKQANKIIFEVKSWSQERRNKLIQYMEQSYPDKLTVDSPFNLMTIEQIKIISESSEFEIGLHSNTHPILSTLNPSEQENEIKLSVDNLIKHNIKYLPIFAYPNGRPIDFDEHSENSLKRNGFKVGFTTIDKLYEISDDRFMIPRISIGSDISKSEFKARLSGYYYFLHGLFKYFCRHN